GATYLALPIVEEEPEWKAGPKDFVAYADTLVLQAKQTLVGLGIPPDVIEVTELPKNRGSYMRWEIRSQVPGDLPLTMCNMALTRLAQRLGGKILEGREDQRARMVSLRAGLGEEGTNLITLVRNDKLKRRTGRLAIIIDDFGYQDRGLIAGFCAILQPLTFSIFPEEEETIWTSVQARKLGHGVMVHLPMEPIDYPARDPGPNAIFTDYSPERIRKLAEDALMAVPGARGVNNHMGSRATENEAVMKTVMAVIRDRDFFFVDSVTSRLSVAYDVAQKSGIRSARNTMFLDHVEDMESVVKKLYELAKRARAEGTVIGIGHAKEGTLKALLQVLPELQADGFEFVLAQDAVR
ncbi:MAG: divergent polysaccharide deacetylase family protein, partial [bacterium]|nr:divergent polysaccharide deacetylase family protein [bacterium]